MKADLGFIREKFRHFNALCFEGKLPEVALRISSSARTMGCLRWTRQRFRTPRPEDFAIWISNRYDVAPEILEDTLIHEMIHLHIQWNGIRDTSAHGEAFRAHMHRINRDYGRHLSVSHRLSEEERQSDTVVRHRLLLVVSWESGPHTVTVLNPRFAIDIIASLKHYHSYRSHSLWLTSGKVFMRYPLSRTSKFYHIDPAVLEQELAKANPVEIEGTRLRMLPRK